MADRTVFEVWVEKYGLEEADKRETSKNQKISESNKKRFENPKEREKSASKGDKNPMHGKSVKSVWIEKYGLEKAEEMWEASNEKRRISQKRRFKSKLKRI